MAYPESLVQALVLDFCALEAFMKQQKARGWGDSFGRWKGIWLCGDPKLTVKMEVQAPGRPTQTALGHSEPLTPWIWGTASLGRSSSPDWGRGVSFSARPASERRWQEPREDLSCSVVLRKSLSRERDAPNPPTHPAPLHKASQRTQTPPSPVGANWVRDAFPPLRPAARGLREAWG